MGMLDIFNRRRSSPDAEALEARRAELARIFDPLAGRREAEVSAVEYAYFLLALPLAVYQERGGRDKNAISDFVLPRLDELISFVRNDLPYDRTPGYFRKKIFHNPDMRNYLDFLVWEKKKDYLQIMASGGPETGVSGLAARVAADVFPGASDTRALRTEIEEGLKTFLAEDRAA